MSGLVLDRDSENRDGRGTAKAGSREDGTGTGLDQGGCLVKRVLPLKAFGSDLGHRILSHHERERENGKLSRKVEPLQASVLKSRPPREHAPVDMNGVLSTGTFYEDVRPASPGEGHALFARAPREAGLWRWTIRAPGRLIERDYNIPYIVRLTNRRSTVSLRSYGT